MPKSEAQILQDIETARLKKKYISSAETPQDSFIDLSEISLDDCKEKPNSLECMMLKLKYEGLSARRQNNKPESMDLCKEKCDSSDVGNSSFKILSCRNVEPLKLAIKINDADIVLSPKKKVKSKMSRLSLKRMLNNGPETVQSNLNSFLDVKSDKIACSKVLDKPRKNKKSSKNLAETNDEVSSSEVRKGDKVVYKISTAIFGTLKPKKKTSETSEQTKKRNGKSKNAEREINIDSKIPKENKTKKNKKSSLIDDKINLTDKFNDQIDKKLQEGLELEVEHCEVDNQIISQENKEIKDISVMPNSPEPKSPKFSIDLTSEKNLELELISDESKNRKCKSLELAKKSPITPKKVRLSNEIKSFSPEKKFIRTPSYKQLPGLSSQKGSDETPKKSNTNALQLMMNMRNKVIGRNSPGKEEKVEDFEEDLDIIQRKTMLQQWVFKKGNIGKRKLADEERGEYIEFVLEKRAKRLKKLLNCEDTENIDIQISPTEIRNKKPEMETKTSKYMEEMSKSINSTKKDSKNNSIEETDEMTLNNKKTVNKKSKKREKHRLADADNYISSPLKQNVSFKDSLNVGNLLKCEIKNTAILIDENSSDQPVPVSFSIFDTAKSSPKFQRKPLQQTLLFCISNIDKSSSKEGSENKNVHVEIVTTSSSPKKNVKKRRKLSLKEINGNKDIEKDRTRNHLVDEDLKVEENVNEKSIEKIKQPKRNRIIDSDESSRDSATSKSFLNIDKASTVEKDNLNDISLTGRCSQLFKKSKNIAIKEKRGKVKLGIAETKVSADHLSQSTKEDSLEVTCDDASDLRRSCRVRKPIEKYYDIIEKSPEREVKIGKTKSKVSAQKDAKVASVFLKAVPKPKVDPAILEARRIFLHSASPIKMRETAVLIENGEFPPFPIFSHIQQKTDSEFWNLPSIELLKSTISLDNIPSQLNYEQLQLSSFTNCHNSNIHAIKLRKLTEIQNKKSILLDIKGRNPDYPVYKSYKLLKLKHKHARITLPPPDLNKTVPRKLLDDSCLIIESDSENSFVHDDLVQINIDSATLWTDKYKPTCSEDIIGNRSAAIDLLKFLKDRLLYCNVSSSKKKARKSRDSDDDFVSSDDDNSNSKDIRLVGNTMLLRGPHGSGKTSSIYAVCQELDINVLELNASSKRTGRILTQKLQEATQSQQIHKQKDLQEIGSQNSEKSLSKMCLLLVEDIDVVFEQDEGFIAALTQLLQTTKRPIVLTFTDETNIHVQRFIQQYPVITFLQLSAKTCSVWLQLICLLENVLIDDGSLGELLEWNKGDLRRTLLQLQFWGLTGGDYLTKTVDSSENRRKIFRKLGADDTIDVMDDSNTSEVNKSVLEIEEFQHQQVINCFLVDNGLISSRLNLGQIWWNFEIFLKKLQSPEIMEKSDNAQPTLLIAEETSCSLSTLPSKKNVLKSIQVFYESLSISDCLLNKIDQSNVDLEPTSATFETKLKDSLSLHNFDDCFTTERDNLKGMMDFLVDRSFSQIINERMEGCRFNMGVPAATDRRWRCKQSDCQDTFLAKLPLHLTFEHKSFALDYFPTLISIVKMEQIRLKMNAKRRNRFYSYLRNLDLKFSDSQITSLNSVFSSKH